jgi:hypothetical protein
MTINPSIKEGEIPVLPLWQPWASLLVTEDPDAVDAALKEYETRGWDTDYRGIIAVHATLKCDSEIATYVEESPHLFGWVANKANLPRYPTCRGLLTAMRQHLPYGAIIGTVEIVSTHPTHIQKNHVSARELDFGNWLSGRYAFRCAYPKKFESPVPFKASQGWNSIPTSLLAEYDTKAAASKQGTLWEAFA